MTIERRRFVDQLAARPIQTRPTTTDRTTLDRLDLRPAEIEALDRNSDGVISGRSEVAALYDRLVALDQARPLPAGNLSRADQMYQHAVGYRTGAGQSMHTRFEGHDRLQRVQAGNATLRLHARGDDVAAVQQALIDLGFNIPTNGASGRYDAETAQAVRLFQRETGQGVDGVVGEDTLGKLNELSPPAGQHLERNPDYTQLYADGRLDATMAVGFDEGGAHTSKTRDIVHSLTADGFRPLDVGRLDADTRTRLGLSGDRYDPNADYFHRVLHTDSGDVDSVVRLITPSATARASFEQAMEHDEVIIYTGHARYGTGPDFDIRTSGDGNFVIDRDGNPHHSHVPDDIRQSLRGQPSGLQSVDGGPDYQLLVFNGCTTENYMHSLRDPAQFPGRDGSNTDIITTSIAVRTGTGSDHALRFLSGIEERESMNDLLEAQNRIETDFLTRHGMDDHVPAARNTYYESGLLDNPGNRYVNNP